MVRLGAPNVALPSQSAAGIFTGRDVMKNRSKLVAVLVASLALAPVLAAGRPACCKTSSTISAPRGCCAARPDAKTPASKGCCKTPAAPQSEAKAKDVAPVELAASHAMGSPALVSAELPELAAVRVARNAHRAATPDDSPPDILSRIRVLLI